MMDEVEDVNIEANGTFKYILIKLTGGGKTKTIVRGYNWAEYHGMECDD